jgi:ribose/xylose/arabinose/galactoside ABC-type transport system permease subunit
MSEHVNKVNHQQSLDRIGENLRKALSGNGVWVILLGMIVLVSFITPNFFTEFNIGNLLSQSALLGVLAIAQFLVILSGGFDLSVAAIMALSSCIIAKYGTGNIWLFIIVAILVGLALGFVNGISITRGKVPPMIATLAMAGIARGLAFNVTSQSLSVGNPIIKVLGGSFSIFSYSTIIWILTTLLVALFLYISKTGTYIYAVGGNESTARLAGIKVNRIKILVYSLAGLISGLAGVLFVIRAQSGVPGTGIGWELDTIAAVVIGGTRLNGGEGRLLSAMAGVLIYMLIRNALNIIGLDPYFQDIIKAAIILLAVGLGMIRFTRNKRSE